MENSVYKENQYFKTIIVIFVAMMIVLTILYVFKMDGSGKPMTLKPFVFFQLVCLFVLALFYKMVVEIRGNVLSISFGCGLIKKKFNTNNIRKDTIKTRKVPLNYGAGIRSTPFGTLYNTSSGQAVTFTTRKENKRFAIGTQNSSRLIEILKGYRQNQDLIKQV